MDITERIEAQNTILNALNEKEILLKEIHHRVKNNFQIITSLLSLQENMITDKAVLDIFEDISNRIKSMALIHELMYRTDNFSALNLKDYIYNLTEHLKLSYSAMNDKILIRLDIDDIQLEMDDLIPNGLIINELVSNAYKHAFPRSKNGTIKVSFKQEGKGRLSLSVADDGAGLVNKPDFNEPKTLGLFLVTTLVKQLKGNLQINALNPGTEFKINFTRAI